MKNRIINKFIVILTALAVGMVTMCGCASLVEMPAFSEMPSENGFIYWEGKIDLSLMGITAEAVDEDGAVVIPKTINGRSVTRIGRTQSAPLGEGQTGGFYIERDLPITEIYIPSTVTNMKDIDIPHDYKVNGIKIYLNFNKFLSVSSYNLYAHFLSDKYIYPIDVFFAYQDNDAFSTFLAYYGYSTSGRRIANVYFEANPNADYEFHYWIDYIEGESVLRKPKVDPERDGYRFTGWYTEPECINEWDFNDSIELTKIEAEKNNSISEYIDYLSNLENSTITLYAGWKEI